MYGVVLATRTSQPGFRPLDRILSRYLLPVFDRPMVCWSLVALAEAGVTEATLVVEPAWIDQYQAALGDGSEYGVQLRLVPEDGLTPLQAARQGVPNGRDCLVLLADNLFEENLLPARNHFEEGGLGALIMLNQSPDPMRFGVPSIQHGRVVRIDEKPSQPASQYAVTGIYFFDSTVWEKLDAVRADPASGSDLTAINNRYIQEGRLGHSLLAGWWTDVADYPTLLQASIQLSERQRVRRSSHYIPTPLSNRMGED